MEKNPAREKNLSAVKAEELNINQLLKNTLCAEVAENYENVYLFSTMC